MSTTLTPIYRFRLRDLDDRLWHDDVNNNFRSLEALLNAAFNVPDYRGTWANSTLYAAGDRAVDAESSTIYQCAVEHTSAATGTFAEDRAANPSYWTSFTYTAASVDALIAKALRYPDADVLTLSAELPPAATRAGNLLGFDASGEPLMVAISVASGVTVTALWANILDETTADASLAVLGFSAYVRSLLASANAPALRALLGSGALGDTLFTAATAIAAFNAIHANGADIASAATINLTTATGDVVDVTGTTTITTITLAEGYTRVVRFTGALTLTNGASLVLPGGANIQTAAGDYAIFRGYGSGVVRCVSYVKASGRPLGFSWQDMPDGTIIQVVRTTLTTYTTLAAPNQIPADDTIPQNTEGVQAFEVTITPKSTTSRVRVRTSLWGSTTENIQQAVIALFKDSEANALAAMLTSDTRNSTNGQWSGVLEFEHVPGTTSPVTYKVRVGSPGSTTAVLYLNGGAANRFFGGVGNCELVAEEIKAS